MHKLTRADFNRRFGRIDLMLTAHSVLRDRYWRRARALTLAILALSIVGIALAFVADRPLTVLGVSARLQVWLGSLAAAIFFLALVDLQVDWRGGARSHSEATARLSDLKAKFAAARIGDPEVASEVDLSQEYERTMAAVVPIPERAFVKLKAKHRRKVAVSKLLDERPGAPMVLLRWEIFRAGLRRTRSAVKRAEAPPN
jgi:hypothetical protein